MKDITISGSTTILHIKIVTDLLTNQDFDAESYAAEKARQMVRIIRKEAK